MKKQIIILVLKLLESESDQAHPMTQTQIASIISAVYPCDRKTVGRNLGFLKKMGYPIVKTTRGYYLDNKPFSIEERDLIISSIAIRTDITEQQKSDLVSRLSAVLNKIFR